MILNLISALLHPECNQLEAVVAAERVEMMWIDDPQARAVIEAIRENQSNDRRVLDFALRGTPAFRRESPRAWLGATFDENAGIPSMVEKYIAGTRVAWINRRRGELAAMIGQHANDKERCDQYVQELHELAVDEQEQKAVRHIATGWLDVMAERMRDEDGDMVPSHSSTVDRLAPIRKSHVTVLTGRTGEGKTAFAMSLALHAAESGRGVLVVSLEMKAAELTDRIIANKSNIPLSKILKPLLGDDNDRAAWRRAASELDELPIHVMDAAAVSINDIATQCRRCMLRQPFDLLVIDYLQIVEATDRRAQRAQQVAEVSRRVKQLAMELDVAVLLLAQLNRQADGDKTQPPQLHQLKDSSSIEQDCSVALILHGPDEGKLTEVHIGKHRSGKKGVALMQKFDRPFSRFSDINGTEWTP